VIRFVAVGDLMVDVTASGKGHSARITTVPGGSALNEKFWNARVLSGGLLVHTPPRPGTGESEFAALESRAVVPPFGSPAPGGDADSHAARAVSSRASGASRGMHEMLIGREPIKRVSRLAADQCFAGAVDDLREVQRGRAVAGGVARERDLVARVQEVLVPLHVAE